MHPLGLQATDAAESHYFCRDHSSDAEDLFRRFVEDDS
jgi:hypothetical protein